MNFSKIMGILVVLLMATTIAFAGTTSDLKNDLKNINDVKNTANISDLKLVNNIKNTITNSELKITNSELKTTNDKKNTSSTNIESTINVMPSTDITNTINSLSSNNRVDLKPNYTVGLVFVDAENLSLIPAESVKITHKYCVGKKCTKETFTPNANPWVANEKVGTHEYIIEAKGHESSSILFNLNKNDVFTQLFLLKPMQKLGKGTFYIIDSKTGQLIDIAKTPVYAIENTCVASNEETKCANKEVIIKENPFTLERVSGTYLYTFSAKGYEDYSSKVQYKVETGFNEKVFLKKATPPEVKGQINIKVVDENGGWINPSLITYNMNICPLIPEPNSTCQGIDNTGVLDNPFSIKTTPQHIYTVEVMVNGYASVKKSYSITGNEVVYDTVQMKKSTAPLVKTIVTVFAIGSTDSNTVDTNIIVEPSAADANFSITSSPFDTNTSTTTWARLTNNPIISYLPYGDYMYKIYSNKYGLGSVKFSITSDETKNVSLLLTK